MNPIAINRLLELALLEDIGHGDITTEAIFSHVDLLEGYLIAKQEGRIAGLDIAKQTFQLLDQGIHFTFYIEEGADVEKGTIIAELKGKARAILSGERVALNLLQRMSGIATETRDICKIVEDLPVKIADTRKTLPGLRMLDKYAVFIGGGSNHRFGLSDAVMIKDNHISGAGSISKAVELVRQYVGHMVKIEVEAENLEQVKEAVESRADVILLDNMLPSEIKESLKWINGRAITEASGGINPKNIREYALTGVDIISLGWITHTVRALDISLEVKNKG
ncbi:carboxylating nicotinate-nucleotide diphosphorylase [Microaerobacter geothermalis]|uniref:carboxylating nicotinate-nucleotide diphosphorylase n=1 Tax=Microaerobacter geothermalis TaxID=674972 RepID=UPI001F2B036E|nr:carboxylating nicotinate-nucleotide diphosphorylase [Microaerobacter geothermalis]MCF6093078.1 carboxylating nicotinate-nucleotide diphosphorylase [Microaerobacter geothermalis]